MSGLGCGEFERPLMDMARHRPMDAAASAKFQIHLEVCERCRAALKRQMRLSAAMVVLADEAVNLSAPRPVEQAILAEVSAVCRSRRQWFVWQALGGVLAASLALAWWLASRPVKQTEVANHGAPPVVAQETRQQPASAQQVVAPTAPKRVRKMQPAPKPEEPFIAIPYAPPLDPYERIDVVRMDMPVAALIAAGLPVEMMDPSARAKTDVLIGQDGRARAVRLVSYVSSN